MSTATVSVIAGAVVAVVGIVVPLVMQSRARKFEARVEHARWLRDRRAEQYVVVLKATTEYLMPSRSKTPMNDAVLESSLFASDRVRAQVNAFADVAIASDAEARKMLDTPMAEAYRHLRDALIQDIRDADI